MINNEVLYVENYKVRTVLQKNNCHLNSIFLPGGPGLGSEYLYTFARSLDLPGNTFLSDFPGDGSNRLSGYKISWETWREGLIKLVERCSPCVLITHSFSGMVALSIPELDDRLAGIILMNTTTNRDFLLHQQASAKKFGLPDLATISSGYIKDPNDKTLKEFINSYKNYFFLPEEAEEGENLLSQCAINSECYQWASHVFIPSYEAKLVPKKSLCMVISSEHDYICPPELFLNNQAYDGQELYIIKNAGHFPWLNHFPEIKEKFNSFYKKLYNKLPASKLVN